MNVVFLVPRRAGVRDRDLIWQFCKPRWQKEHPRARVIEGEHDDGGPFNRSVALNRAAADGGAWDVAVILDSDVMVPAEQVNAAIERAVKTGGPVLAYTDAMRLSAAGTRRILQGFRGNWNARGYVQQIYYDMCSQCLVVTRALWDRLGGFDESFVGWGYEDNAFACAAETVSGVELARISGPCWHLFHRNQPRTTTLIQANRARLERYHAARGDAARMLAVIEDSAASVADVEPGIPRILHRTVPARTSSDVERYWSKARQLHPAWECRTHRDPLPPRDWPRTAHLWDRCTSGAQRAGLIRLEALVRHGGVYIDSDVELFRPLDSLLGVSAFACWEDAKVVPDAVIGATAHHEAIERCLHEASKRVVDGKGAWDSGPGVTTDVFVGRNDVLLLPPGSFYPYHYTEKERRRENHRRVQPWAFGAHHWNGSWL